MTDADHEIIVEVFKELGVDAENIEEIRELRKDLEWVRQNRKRCQTVIGKLIVWSALIVAGGTLALIGEGIRTKFGIGK